MTGLSSARIMLGEEYDAKSLMKGSSLGRMLSWLSWIYEVGEAVKAVGRPTV